MIIISVCRRPKVRKSKRGLWSAEGFVDTKKGAMRITAIGLASKEEAKKAFREARERWKHEDAK